MSKQRRKLVVVGDGGVGKSSLLTALVKGVFISGRVSPFVENYELDMDVRGELIVLELWHAAAEGMYNDPLRYMGSHAFLLCFSVDCPDSLDNVVERWDPQVKRFGAGKVPRFLVGCQSDLRDDERTLGELARILQVPVTADRGKEIAEAIGAEYFECSSKTGEGVRELFVRVTESMEADKVAHFEREDRGCIVA